MRRVNENERDQNQLDDSMINQLRAYLSEVGRMKPLAISDVLTWWDK